MLLSILILTIPCRAKFLARLKERLMPQVTPDVEVLLAEDDGEVSIGQKRNEILARAKGRFVCFIDDDDLVSTDYVSRITDALKSEPDCVGFKATRTIDGKPWGQTTYSRRFSANRNFYDGPQARYERLITHVCPVRREFACATGFKHLSQAEDTDYSERLRHLLNTEEFVDSSLYVYEYRSPGARNEVTNARDK